MAIGSVAGCRSIHRWSPVPEGHVLLLHEGWGRHVGIDGIVDRLTALGHRVLAPDLFAGRPRARTFAALPHHLRTASGPMVEAVRSMVSDLSGKGPLAIVGLSLGAAIALRLDTDVPVVAAYGHAPRRLRCTGPVLAVYGTADRPLRTSGRRLEAAGVRVLWVEGAGHSFLLDGDLPFRLPGFGPHPGSAGTWDAIVAFLDREPVESLGS